MTAPATSLDVARSEAGARNLLRKGERWAVFAAFLFGMAMAVAGVLADDGEAFLRLADVNLDVMGAMLGLSLVNYALRAARWDLFARTLGIRVPAGRGLVYYVAGFAMTVTPGKLGEAVRLWFLKRGEAVPLERSAGLLVADRLADAGAIALLCLGGLASFPGLILPASLVVAMVVAAAMVLARPGWIEAAITLGYRLVGSRFGGAAAGARLFAKLRRTARGMRALASWRVSLPGLLIGLVGWTAEASAFEILANDLGIHIALPQAMFIFAFAMAVGSAAMLPGGLGGTEATMAALLVASGAGTGPALAATAGIRVTTLWFAVALGTLAYPVALRLASRLERRRTG